jgi:hypothetical protein
LSALLKVKVLNILEQDEGIRHNKVYVRAIDSLCFGNDPRSVAAIEELFKEAHNDTELKSCDGFIRQVVLNQKMKYAKQLLVTEMLPNSWSEIWRTQNARTSSMKALVKLQN